MSFHNLYTDLFPFSPTSFFPTPPVFAVSTNLSGIEISHDDFGGRAKWVRVLISLLPCFVKLLKMMILKFQIKSIVF